MGKNQIIQDSFLNELCQQGIEVSIFLVNGIKLHGTVDGFDKHVIMLKSSVTQMIYKHAISTVVPSRLITYSASEDS